MSVLRQLHESGWQWTRAPCVADAWAPVGDVTLRSRLDNW